MNTTGTAFEGLLDDYWESTLARNPILANYSGLPQGEGKLGNTGLTHETQEEHLRARTLARLDRINPHELSNEQHMDRLALRALLLRESEDFARKRHSMQPDAPEMILNLLLHELQRGDNEPSRAAKNVRSVLRQIPGCLENASVLIDRPEPVWLKIMQDTVKGAPSLFDAVSKFLAANAPKNRTPPAETDAGLAEEALKSIDTYRRNVESRPVASPGSFAIGAESLQRRVRDDLGLDYTLGQIESLAEAEALRVGALLARECATFGKKQSPEQIVDKARSHWDPGEDLLKTYREETYRMAEAFKAARAVSFPKGQTLAIRPVPEFMQHLFPTAAYSSPGPFEKRQQGVFWVNDLSTTKTSAKEKLAERQQHFGLCLTAAHEAYPGHHLQFTTANKHPRTWRRMFSHAVFYEGWTLWCEQMVVDLKIDNSPWLRVQQLHDALWRVHRILVDLRLQTGRYSYEQGVRHMVKHLGFTRARAEADVNWYTSSPAVPMSYWLGRLENARLHDRLVKGRGWSLRKFNDWLLSFGTIPQGWIEKYGLD